MFENEYRGYVMENEYMRNLAAQGIELTNSFGVMHPSQTNYITSISGELCNVSDDDKPAPLLQNTIVDLIEASPYNLRWKAYMDSYVADIPLWKPTDFTPKDNYPYVIKHNPFSSFKNILDNEQRWRNIESEAGFYRDLLNDDFPEYAWFTPNMWNDGHYLVGSTNNDLKGERAPVLVNQQAKWLKSFFSGLNFPGPNSKLPPNTLVVVTYDEADFEKLYDTGEKYPYDGPNQIYTVLLGDMITPSQQSEGYNHYSLLKTIEKNFNLGDLQKNDRDANWFQFLWGKEFQWQLFQDTPLKKLQNISATSYQDQLFIVAADKKQHLYYRTFNSKYWSPEVTLAKDCSGQLAIAANDEQLVLVYCNKANELMLKEYDQKHGWQECKAPDCGKVVQISLIAIPNQQGFLMVYQTPQDQLFSLYFDKGKWQKTPVSLCCHCDGQFTLTSIGPSLLLIYRKLGSDELSCFSYNTAEFNQITVAESKYAGPYDDTSINKWSASSFSLIHYGSGASNITPQEDEPTLEGYDSNGIIAASTLDGIIHLIHNNPGNNQLLTETFSISGVLTPEYPVSYNLAKNKTTSNGYGTMFEAGWSKQKAIGGILRDPDSPLATARLGDQLWIFYQPLDSDSICACPGSYLMI